MKTRWNDLIETVYQISTKARKDKAFQEELAAVVKKYMPELFSDETDTPKTTSGKTASRKTAQKKKTNRRVSLQLFYKKILKRYQSISHLMFHY